MYYIYNRLTTKLKAIKYCLKKFFDGEDIISNSYN